MVFFGNWNVDNKIMESFLDKMNIVSGSDRNKLLYVNKKIGGSALFGTTWKSYVTPTKNRPPCTVFKGQYLTKLVEDNPHMEFIFREFANLYFPDFFYTQIQVNKNYRTPPHKDSMNVGESILCAFGTYEGGLTAVDFGSTVSQKWCFLNAREKPCQFNGSKFTHYTQEWDGGNRYSLVFFNNIKNIEKKLINPQQLLHNYIK